MWRFSVLKCVLGSLYEHLNKLTSFESSSGEYTINPIQPWVTYVVRSLEGSAVNLLRCSCYKALLVLQLEACPT